MSARNADRNERQGGKVRAAFLTWLGVYPVLTIIAVLLEPLLAPMSIPLRTLLMSAVMVPVMVFWIMPAITRWSSKSYRPELHY